MSMLGFAIGLGHTIAVLEAEKRERQYFEKSLEGLPPEEQTTRRKAREELREKMRQEATAERRHQELCNAIRSTSFWRFGS